MDEYSETPEVLTQITTPQLTCCDEKTKRFLEKQHDKWTMEQMNEIINFVQNKLNKLRAAAEEDVTIEDFEKAKKIDVDEDGEEGEIGEEM